ncbi:hypothetical protein PLICRDRAFT_175735 [Plicaturopsis crispa FD-325 SS-3]|nr:hypothetical protein PLICRDRAFT_175735 [Plicaturopsis crispa FD-325 SS-3]
MAVAKVVLYFTGILYRPVAPQLPAALVQTPRRSRADTKPSRSPFHHQPTAPTLSSAPSSCTPRALCVRGRSIGSYAEGKGVSYAEGNGVEVGAVVTWFAGARDDWLRFCVFVRSYRIFLPATSVRIAYPLPVPTSPVPSIVSPALSTLHARSMLDG